MTERKKTIEDMTRAKLVQVLPDAIEQALLSYYSFMDAGMSEEEMKKFSEAHKAAKVAISHIELLIKLAKWAELPDSAMLQQPDSHLVQLISQATQDVDSFRDRSLAVPDESEEI